MSMSAIDDRRELVRRSTTDSALAPVNGIDFIQIDPADEARLIVQFIFDIDTDVDPPLSTALGVPLSKQMVSIAGGERIRSIAVESVQRGPGSNQLQVIASEVGDFSTYTLRIGPQGEAPPDGFDPVLCVASFTFHVECSKRFDCKDSTVCVLPAQSAPNIDYLACDYPAFVRVMLDRLALLAPRWRERNPADLGVAVVETLAYVADQLGYRHDVIDTEAYLGTARLRTSIRRHARLVDYRLDDGNNARVWLALLLDGDLPQGVPPGTRCATIFDGASAPDLRADTQTYNAALAAGAQFFEVMADRFTADKPPRPNPRPLSAVNNRMPLYEWSAETVCLPAGATTATLDGAYTLQRGDILMLAEACGPDTGAEADADPARRCVVRLVSDSTHSADPLTRRLVTHIVWHEGDALPFPLCISSVTDQKHGSLPIKQVSFAYGNVVLADHGRTLGSPLEATQELLAGVPPYGRYRPALSQPGVTLAALNPYIGDQPGDLKMPIQPASGAASWSAADIVPTIALASTDIDHNALAWAAVGDLLEGGVEGETTAFETEVENDGTTYLRFGDGVNGHAVEQGMEFHASYRVGNGAAGNVAADSIMLIDRSFKRGGMIRSVTNPLPAFGGRDAETIAHARQNAPVAFRQQERAVTAQDYVDRALQFAGVARAAASLRYTGSWTTVFVTVERESGVALDASFKSGLEAYLDRYRMAGHDLEVEDAVRVPLRVAMHVCVATGYVAADLAKLLLAIFTSGLQPDGTPGLFNPQRFLMGEPFYLSPLIAAAQQVEGVASVKVTRFEREQVPDRAGLRTGVLVPRPTELFELANNPDFPERGQFELTIDGGI
ncbi:putative baseplate assembly protein [Paraburkholderia terrae]|uniref:Baseplate assembly protein n=1 Tax=Paraburkholderia terrae TaxID=311230 RepID=A0ABM7TZ51_9BURK|nr:putative baseplate assembly protein [Paraburkholderia terrae]BCZ84365.1 putative baseplate assembly protein [Paraburkholderia terrae]